MAESRGDRRRKGTSAGISVRRNSPIGDDINSNSLLIVSSGNIGVPWSILRDSSDKKHYLQGEPSSLVSEGGSLKETGNAPSPSVYSAITALYVRMYVRMVGGRMSDGMMHKHRHHLSRVSKSVLFANRNRRPRESRRNQ